MSVTVIVRSGHAPPDGSPPPLTFDGSRVVIGRGPGCDVRLPDPSVSHRHASVRANGSDYTLVDEGSTNGTFVGGVRLSPHAPRALRSGDLVRIGRVWLELRIEQAPATRDLAAATRDLALALVADAMRAMGDDVLPRVRVVEGRDLGATLTLAEEGRTYVLGRGETCDLPLEDADASREHAQIVRRGGTVLVRDLGSKNGVQLGEARVPAGRDVPWRAQNMMRLGTTVLALEEPVAQALASLEQAEDEPMPAPQTPEPAPAAAEVPGEPLGTSAPIAAPPAGRAPGATERSVPRSGWSGADIAVVVAALGVIAMSIAGLYWLLRG